MYWLWLITSILVIDRITKHLVMCNFALGESKALFFSVNLYYTVNYGIAFSLFDSDNSWQRWFFSGVSLIICIILVLFIYQSRKLENTNNAAYAVIIGGALGNLWDRLRYGFVVDMIDVYIKHWHFATFNVADSAIFFGTSFLLIKNLFFEISK